MNIIIRVLMYLAQTYHDYFERTKQNLYNSKKVQIPKPEAYVIYTGKRKTKPENISLSREFFGGEKCCLDIEVKMIYGGEKGDIISQYVTFTKVCDEQIAIYGRTKKAILETIRICKDKNVLKEYLESREKEVVDIMMVLYDAEEVFNNYVNNKVQEETEKAVKAAVRAARREAKRKGRQEGREEGREEGRQEGKAEGREEGRQEGRAEGREEGRQEGELYGIRKGKMELVRNLLSDGTLSPEKIAEISGIPLEAVEELRNSNK